MNWTESDIQALKAQEAKDLAVELLQKLEAKEKGPISPGEVQIKELDFELEAARGRERGQASPRGSRAANQGTGAADPTGEDALAEAESHANEVRESFAHVVERVNEAGESLSTQLERATREHNLKVEQLESTFAVRAGGTLEATHRSWSSSETRFAMRSTY